MVVGAVCMCGFALSRRFQYVVVRIFEGSNIFPALGGGRGLTPLNAIPIFTYSLLSELFTHGDSRLRVGVDTVCGDNGTDYTVGDDLYNWYFIFSSDNYCSRRERGRPQGRPVSAFQRLDTGGANSRLFDCFPRQTAHGSFIDGTLVSVDITSLKDWYRRLSFYIYLDILFIRFHTGIVPPFFQRCFKNNVSVVWFTYPPHCTLYIHL